MHDPGLITSQRNSIAQWLSRVNPSDGIPPVEPEVTIFPDECQAPRVTEVPGGWKTPPLLRSRASVMPWGLGGNPVRTRVLEPFSAAPVHQYPDSRILPNTNHFDSRTLAPGYTATEPSLGNTYEKKPRRKTRKDRYDPKYSSKVRGAIKETINETSKRVRNVKKTKRKHGRRGLEDKFTAPNVSQSRLTLSSNFDLGLFSRGRASSPTRRCELPDLTFSEMKFLSRRGKQSQADNITAVNKRTTPSRPPILEISEYFSRSQSAGRHQNSCTSPILQKKSGPSKDEEQQIFKNENGPAASLNLQHSCEAKDSCGRVGSQSATYYTWSDTNFDENSRCDNSADGAHQTRQLMSRNSDLHFPSRSTTSPIEDWAKESALTNDFEYDPFIVSKVHEMIFKNAYLDQVYESTTSSNLKVYSLEELQRLASQPLEFKATSKSNYTRSLEEQLQASNICLHDLPGSIASPRHVPISQNIESLAMKSPASRDKCTGSVHIISPKFGTEQASPVTALDSQYCAPQWIERECFSWKIENMDNTCNVMTAAKPANRCPKSPVKDTKRRFPDPVYSHVSSSLSSDKKRPRILMTSPFSVSNVEEHLAQMKSLRPQPELHFTELDIQDEISHPSTPPRTGLFDEIELYTLASLDSKAWNEPLLNEYPPKTTDYLGGTCLTDQGPHMFQHTNMDFEHELQNLTGTRESSSVQPLILPFDTAHHSAPQEQQSSYLTSVPGLSLFWRPNKLY